MNPSEFEDSEAGEIVAYQIDGEKVSTFVPNPLPPSVEYDNEMVRLVEQAASNLNELDGISTNLPSPEVFIRPYILKEAVLSSQIEGTQTSFEEAVVNSLSESEIESRKDMEEVQNYVKALNYGIDRLGKEPLTVDLIKRIHEKLMSGVRGQDKSPGSFRDKQVHTGDIGAPREDADYVPMRPEKIEESMENLVEFINEESETPYLVKSALVHYQFEAIHPFEDGNGRMGRLLIVLDMIDQKKLSRPLLYLSEFFNNNRGRYYDSLMKVSRDGDYVNWIKFFLRAVKVQSNESRKSAQKILEKKEEYKSKLRENNEREEVIVLMENIFDLEPRTVNEVSEELDVTYHTARNYIKKLQDYGVLDVKDETAKQKEFVAKDLIEIMNHT